MIKNKDIGMQEDGKRLVRTAYDESTSRQYDEVRFTDTAGKLFNTTEIQQLDKALRLVGENAAIVEVGCGTGRFVQHIARRGFDVVGIDPSEFMLEEARARCDGLKNARFIHAEGQSTGLESNEFDLAFAIRVLNQTSSDSYALSLIEEMIRLVKPGGCVLVEFVNKWRPSRLRHSQCVRLTFRQIEMHIGSLKKETEVIERSGILILSETLLKLMPVRLQESWLRIDKVLSCRFPYLASRCYELMRVNRDR